MRIRLRTPFQAGVVQQQNTALPRLRRRCDSVHPLQFRGCSSSAERSFDMREAKGAAPFVPTITEGIAQSAEGVRHMHQVEGAIPSALTISSVWCSPVNMPASHAGDYRSEAGQGRQFHLALKALSAMHSLGKRISPVQLRVRDPFRSRASAHVGFISPLCPGQYRRLRPYLRLHLAVCGVHSPSLRRRSCSAARRFAGSIFRRL